GLMRRRPRPRGESVLTRPMIVMAGLVGLYAAILNLVLIDGETSHGYAGLGVSTAFAAFALMLVVAAFEGRDERASIFTMDTLARKGMNVIAAVELLLAYLATQMEAFQRILDTSPLGGRQWFLAIVSALGLLACWEVGKWIARRSQAQRAPAGADSLHPV